MLSILIPVYNEERTIVDVLNKVQSINLINDLKKEIVIVNDCSTDSSESIIINFISNTKEKNIQYYSFDKNRGKGAAIRKAISKAKGDFIVVQDADLEYDPNEYNILLKPILDNFADVVYGSRFMGGNPHRVLFFWHTIGNNFLTFLSNIFTDLNLTDMETCSTMFDAKILKNIDLKENRFGFEPEVTAKISRVNKIRIYEVGISYYGRTYEEGKKIGIRDGFRAIWCIIKYNLF